MLFEGHPSWRSIVDFYIKGLLATAVICFLVAIGTEIADERNDSLVVILAIVGVGVTVLVGFIKRVATSYTITNRRLHIKKGIVSRTIQETRLERVQNVNVSAGRDPADLPDRRRGLRHRRRRRLQLHLRRRGGARRRSSRRSTRQRAHSRARAAPGGLGDEQHGYQPPPAQT